MIIDNMQAQALKQAILAGEPNIKSIAESLAADMELVFADLENAATGAYGISAGAFNLAVPPKKKERTAALKEIKSLAAIVLKQRTAHNIYVRTMKKFNQALAKMAAAARDAATRMPRACKTACRDDRQKSASSAPPCPPAYR